MSDPAPSLHTAHAAKPQTAGASSCGGPPLRVSTRALYAQKDYPDLSSTGHSYTPPSAQLF